MNRLPDGSRLDPVFFHQSAGAVVMIEDSCLVLRRSDREEWVFPKGHLEDGETPEDAAIREVLEETGLPIEIVASLGSTRYKFGRGQAHHKRIDWFLALADHRRLALEPIFREAALLDREGAERVLSHSADRDLARRAFDLARSLGIAISDHRPPEASANEEGDLL
jgi:diadenosine hexaphosphate hydrolase (ATP-forming)